MNFHVSRPILVGLAFTSGLMLAEACKSSEANSNHCSFLDGNATCADRYPGQFEYCGGDCVDSENNDGCVEEVPTDCYYPCGGDMLADDDTDCPGTTMTETNASTMDSSSDDPSGDPTTMDDTSTMTMTGDETETDPTETTGPSDCQVSAECTDPTRPVCLDNDCVACTDTPDGEMACNSKDEALPVCRDDGQCVQCTGGNAAACGDTTPVCDDGSSTCVGCTYHEQCEGTACDIATGACFEDCFIEVDGDGTADSATISGAIMDGCIVILHERDAEAPYTEPVVIDGETVAIFAAPGEAPRWEGTGGNPSLTVTGGANVYLHGVWLVGNAVTSILVEADGFAQARNCFIGGDVNDVAAVDVTSASLDVSYSTLAGGFGDAAALRCDGGSTVEVRDSILVARTDTTALDCAPDVLESSATEDDVGVGDMETTWFFNFANGDFHLSGTGAPIFADLAEWNVGDPATDIDGDARAGVDGTPEAAGADLP